MCAGGEGGDETVLFPSSVFKILILVLQEGLGLDETL